MNITIRVPATSANLGPGFDSLGLALDLWNETVITLAIEYTVQVNGEGMERLSPGENNMIIQAAQKLAAHAGKTLPPFHLDCINRIPLSSGLGSSAAAKLTGLLGANKLLGQPFSRDEILNIATELEGHADNAAPALFGGLVVSTVENGKVFAHKIDIETSHSSLGHVEFPFHITVVFPEFHISTNQARNVLPEFIPMKDAAQNIGRAMLVTEAFRTKDLELLGKAMTDTLHQPYRLSLIPGAQQAIDMAKRSGAAAALSGAGPSIIAFSSKWDPAIGEAMQHSFQEAGLPARIFQLRMSNYGAEVHI
jgi:homoserine kinase